MQRFKTLLLREWMQYQRGWLVMMALPFLLVLGTGLFGAFHVDFDNDALDALPPALVLAVAVVLSIAGLTLLLAWLSSMLQSPGLARRDVQDRSIEFWLSLPVSHTQSLGATLLTHLVLWPCLALLVGLGGGLLASLPLVARVFGVGAWFTLPWTALLPALLLLALRLMLGLVLATLWLSPMVLGTMAASAWLKRWGVPAVVGAVAAGGLLLDKLYGNPIVWQVLQFLSRRASEALLATQRHGDGGFAVNDGADMLHALRVMPGWLVEDAGHALAAAASPAFLAAVLAGAAAFAALWLRRRRGA